MPLLLPKGKKRTALLAKLKEIFRASRSQPVGGVIAQINPILRGWVTYFAVGHSSRCFSLIRDCGGEEDSAPSGQGVSAPRFRLEAVGQGMAVRHAWALCGVLRIVRITLGSRSSLIGLISLVANCAGARSAGNPQATCDVAGAGNGATANPKRARRGKPRTQAKAEPTRYCASARPYQAREVCEHLPSVG